MFTIEMLPANEGDALWIEYGDPAAPHRILIDCGRKTAYRAVTERLGDDVTFELFVLSHVDADHIAGAVPLMNDQRFTKEAVRDVWFNGWRHLNGLHKDDDGPKILGAKQGEYFAALIRERGFSWNQDFGGHPVVIPEEGPLPRVELEGGMVLTLLGPTHAKMSAMRDRWQDEIEDLDGLDPGDWETALERLQTDRGAKSDIPVLGHDPFEGPLTDAAIEELASHPFDADGSEPNGSSISFLAEYDGKAVIFSGDAHAPQLTAAIRRLCAERGVETLRVDALKMAHHGSARNNDYELLAALDCDAFLLSSNGTRHHHPDAEAVARIVNTRESSTLYFNYRSPESELWDAPDLAASWGWTAVYPEPGDEGLKVDLG